MGLQALGEQSQEVAPQITASQRSHLAMEMEKNLSHDELFTLLMEANRELQVASDLLSRTTPADPVYKSLKAIHEMIRQKRDNYQHMIIEYAEGSLGSKECSVLVGPEPKARAPEGGSHAAVMPQESTKSTTVPQSQTTGREQAPIPPAPAVTQPRRSPSPAESERSVEAKEPHDKPAEAPAVLGPVETSLIDSLGTGKVYNAQEVEIVLKLLSSASIEVEDAKKFASEILMQLKDQPVSDCISGVSSLITAQNKDHYGTDKDIRYFTLRQCIAVLAMRTEVIKGLASDKPLMMRIGNWLRWERRQKSDQGSEECLTFFIALQPTTKQLTDYRILDVLVKISKGKDALSNLSQTIITNAATKQESLRQPEKKSFSVSDYLLKSKQKAASSSDKTAKSVSHQPVKEPSSAPGEIKSILKKSTNTPTNKTVSFKSDDMLVEVQYFESEQDSLHHSVEEDNEKAKKMEQSEGRLLRDTKESRGISEIEITQWYEPPMVSFDLGEDFYRLDTPITRGGVLPLVLTDDTGDFKRPSVPSNSYQESPLEPEGLVTPIKKFVYSWVEQPYSPVQGSTVVQPQSPPANPTVLQEQHPPVVQPWYQPRYPPAHLQEQHPPVQGFTVIQPRSSQAQPVVPQEENPPVRFSMSIKQRPPLAERMTEVQPQEGSNGYSTGNDLDMIPRKRVNESKPWDPDYESLPRKKFHERGPNNWSEYNGGYGDRYNKHKDSDHRIPKPNRHGFL